MRALPSISCCQVDGPDEFNCRRGGVRFVSPEHIGPGLDFGQRAYTDALAVLHKACYHSGASFADGGKTGPTLVAPMVDFKELLAKYETMWQTGKVIV